MNLLKIVAAALLAMVTNPGHTAALSCGDQPRDASRIAVAGGSLTEILHGLGESARIIAVDTTSNYPEYFQNVPQIGYFRSLSTEGILSLAPTLVIGKEDMGPPEVVAQLIDLGVDVLRVPEVYSTHGIENKVRCVATAVGAEAAGERFIAELKASAADRDPVPAAARPKGVVLLSAHSGSLLAAGEDTAGNGLLSMAGVDNLFDFTGWKPVSVEAMTAAQPEFIVVPEHGVEMAGGLDALLDNPAVRLTPAARNRRVIVMDGGAMLGFGPRTITAASTLRRQLMAAPVADARATSLEHTPDAETSAR